MQDIADRALRKKLDETQAEYGTVILVEAATGKIRALVNLGKLEGDSGYSETVNYAVWAGFFRFKKGSQSAAWQRAQRAV